MHMARQCALSLALVTLLLSLSATSAMVLEQVVVAHRHGARTPVPAVNASQLCPGGAAGCGRLTLQGKQMLTNLGKYLRASYNATIQPSQFYNPDVVHSRSTDVDRTIQSADALLRGLFASLEGTVEEVYPVINMRDVSREIDLLVWDGWPALVMWSAATQVPFFSTLNHLILTTLLNASALNAVGNEIGLSEECDPTRPTFFPFQCAVDAEDYYSYAVSVGMAERLPITGAHYGQLVGALELYNAYAMGRFDEETNGGQFIAAVGSFGFLLADAIVQRLRSPGGRTLTHYSGHDITMMPLYNALGNTTLLNPPFGAALIVESWVESSGDTEHGAVGGNVGATDPWIVIKIGEPGQTPASNFTYTFDNFTMSCIASNGVSYRSQSGCPLSDLARYIATRGPQSPMGICYTSNTTQLALNCTPSMAASDPSYCQYYRSMCLDACGDDGAMTADFECVAGGSSSGRGGPPKHPRRASLSLRDPSLPHHHMLHRHRR